MNLTPKPGIRSVVVGDHGESEGGGVRRRRLEFTICGALSTRFQATCCQKGTRVVCCWPLPPTKCQSRFSCLIVAKDRESFTQFSKFYSLYSQQFSTPSCESPPETLDTACYTAIRNRKGHRSPDQHDRFQAWTVSSCSPHLWSSPADGFGPVATGNLAGPSTDAPVARASWRAASASGPTFASTGMSAPVCVQQTTGQEDHPLAAVFALLLRAAVEVRSTGARGASQKKKRRMQGETQQGGHLTQDPASSPTMARRKKGDCHQFPLLQFI